MATRWRGIPDVIDDEQTGFLVPICDTEAVTDRLGRLIATPALRAEMGRAGRAKFERECTIEQYHARLNAVFRSVAIPRAKALR